MKTPTPEIGADKIADSTWVAWCVINGERFYLRATRCPRLTAKFITRQAAITAAEEKVNILQRVLKEERPELPRKQTQTAL